LYLATAFKISAPVLIINKNDYFDGR
jgi:hypothetical protein